MLRLKEKYYREEELKLWREYKRVNRVLTMEHNSETKMKKFNRVIKRISIETQNR